MPRLRQLLAVLLVAVYAAVTTFGMAFVICVEGDGTRNLEALGAACCAAAEPTSHADAGDEDSFSASNPANGDCGDCQAHLAAIDVDATRVENTQPDTSSPVVPASHPVPSVSAWHGFGLARTAHRMRPHPPRPPPTLAWIRSVVILC